VRIVTLNLNGIRSAAKKGVVDWLAQSEADVVCLQELKAQVGDLSARMLNPPGYFGYFHYAEKKGYSGVGIWSRRQPDQIVEGLGIADIDAEGRYIEAQFGNLSIVSIYLPSGSSGEHRQAAKFAFMARFLPRLETLAKSGREFILCGDWNIAHREIDLKNWKGNRKNSGFLPEERAWIGDLFDRVAWSMSIADFIPSTKARLTPGGATVVRPGPRTSVGASTTRSPAPASPLGLSLPASTRQRGFPTMHR